MRELLIVAGSRSITGSEPVVQALVDYSESHHVTRLVCGCAPGPDRSACLWARANEIPIDFFPAWDWHMEWVNGIWEPARGDTLVPADYKRGRSNGPLRNAAMAAHADAALLIWDGQSHGTKDMNNRMVRAGNPEECPPRT
jgi:hypothetical protein